MQREFFFAIAQWRNLEKSITVEQSMQKPHKHLAIPPSPSLVNVVRCFYRLNCFAVRRFCWKANSRRRYLGNVYSVLAGLEQEPPSHKNWLGEYKYTPSPFFYHWREALGVFATPAAVPSSQPLLSDRCACPATYILYFALRKPAKDLQLHMSNLETKQSWKWMKRARRSVSQLASHCFASNSGQILSRGKFLGPFLCRRSTAVPHSFVTPLSPPPPGMLW